MNLTTLIMLPEWQYIRKIQFNKEVDWRNECHVEVPIDRIVAILHGDTDYDFDYLE